MSSEYWKQVIGKGQQISSSTEDKNYDLYLIGDRVYFEWDDRVTRTHYHVMTDAPAISADTWNYVNLVVEGGLLRSMSTANRNPTVITSRTFQGITGLPIPPKSLKSS